MIETASDAAHIDFLALAVAHGIVPVMRRHFDYVTTVDARTAAGRLAVAAGVCLAVAQVSSAARAWPGGVLRRVTTVVLSLAASLPSGVVGLEQNGEAGDDQFPFARKEREHPPPDVQDETPLTFVLQPARREHLPRVRELMTHVEQRPGVAHAALCDLIGGMSEKLAPLPCRVIDRHNHVAERIHVEEVVFLGKLDAPAADRTQKFER
jgi:hypothetical protein